MQINPCPRCGREPELEKYFKFSKDIGEFYFAGWRYQCLRCCLSTECCKTIDESAAKWNEIMKGEK